MVVEVEPWNRPRWAIRGGACRNLIGSPPGSKDSIGPWRQSKNDRTRSRGYHTQHMIGAQGRFLTSGVTVNAQRPCSVPDSGHDINVPCRRQAVRRLLLFCAAWQPAR